MARLPVPSLMVESGASPPGWTLRFAQGRLARRPSLHCRTHHAVTVVVRAQSSPQALKREYIAMTYGTSKLVPFPKHTWIRAFPQLVKPYSCKLSGNQLNQLPHEKN